MRIVSVSVLKAELADHLRHVKAGEEIIITERGRPVACITPLPQMPHETADLVSRGIVRPGTGRVDESFFQLTLPDDPDACLRSAINEDRGDRG